MDNENERKNELSNQLNEKTDRPSKVISIVKVEKPVGENSGIDDKNPDNKDNRCPLITKDVFPLDNEESEVFDDSQNQDPHINPDTSDNNKNSAFPDILASNKQEDRLSSDAREIKDNTCEEKQSYSQQLCNESRMIRDGYESQRKEIAQLRQSVLELKMETEEQRNQLNQELQKVMIQQQTLADIKTTLSDMLNNTPMKLYRIFTERMQEFEQLLKAMHNELKNNEDSGIAGMLDSLVVMKNRFMSAIVDAGITPAEPHAGDVFDSNTMKSVDIIDGNMADEDLEVVEVVCCGYRYGNSIMQPAIVHIRRRTLHDENRY